MTSPLIQWLRDLDNESTIVTNQAMAVYFLTEIPAYQIPERFDPVKSEERLGYDLEIESLGILLQEPNSYLVLFESSDSTSPSSIDLFENLQLVLATEDGRVYLTPEVVETQSSP